MDKKAKRETNGSNSSVERLDAYVSTGTKAGLAIWGNRLTWQTLFGYVPHFVEQLNTHRGVLEFLGGTFRDKKNSKLINPPQAFFSHQMEQMRTSQVKLSQEVQQLTVRLQDEQSRREAAERRVLDMEEHVESLKRMLLGSSNGMLSSQQLVGLGLDLGNNSANRLFTAHDGMDAGMLNTTQMQSLASKTKEIRDMAASLLAQTANGGDASAMLQGSGQPVSAPSPGANALSTQMDRQCSEADHYLRLLTRGSDETTTTSKRVSGGLEPAGLSEAPSIDDPIMVHLRSTLKHVGPTGSLLPEPLLGPSAMQPMPNNPFAAAAAEEGTDREGGGEPVAKRQKVDGVDPAWRALPATAG